METQAQQGLGIGQALRQGPVAPNTGQDPKRDISIHTALNKLASTILEYESLLVASRNWESSLYSEPKPARQEDSNTIPSDNIFNKISQLESRMMRLNSELYDHRNFLAATLDEK